MASLGCIVRASAERCPSNLLRLFTHVTLSHDFPAFYHNVFKGWSSSSASFLSLGTVSTVNSHIKATSVSNSAYGLLTGITWKFNSKQKYVE